MENEKIPEQIVQEVSRFDTKLELKLISALNKILNFAKYPYNEELAINKPTFCTLDKSNCVMIAAKTTEAKRILCKFIESETQETAFKIPEMNYNNIIHLGEKPQANGEENYKAGVNQTSTYSLNFLLPIIKVFDCFNFSIPKKCRSDDFTYQSVSVDISIKNDYPATFENEHFKIILAPRIKND